MRRHKRRPQGNVRDRFLLQLVSILAVATTLELLLIFVPGAQRWFNDPKAWEFTTQFFFVAILGGAVALVYRHMETLRLEQHQFDQKEQEQRQAQRLSLEEFYRSLVEVHNSCKKVRRTLRAWVVEKDGKLLIETKKFESLMDLIEDVQLRAESSWREVEARPLLFGKHENDLLRHLRTSERYVRELLRQYRGRPCYKAKYRRRYAESVGADQRVHR